MRFGIVVAEWNREVTEALLEGAVRTLRAAGCPDMNIQIKYVPGTFELALGAQFFAEYTDVDAVIALGCVIQGDTRHFDFICQGGYAGHHAAADPVEHAHSVRYPDRKRHAAGIGPLRRPPRQQGR